MSVIIIIYNLYSARTKETLKNGSYGVKVGAFFNAKTPATIKYTDVVLLEHLLVIIGGVEIITSFVIVTNSPLKKNRQFWSKSKQIDFSLRFRTFPTKNVLGSRRVRQIWDVRELWVREPKCCEL